MTSSKTAASGRLSVLREAEPGAGSWIHRWLGDDFHHLRYDDSPKCLCNPIWVPPSDKRSLDEIADDIEDEEEPKN